MVMGGDRPDTRSGIKMSSTLVITRSSASLVTAYYRHLSSSPPPARAEENNQASAAHFLAVLSPQCSQFTVSSPILILELLSGNKSPYFVGTFRRSDLKGH